jgi:3'-5' exoribonuclease
MILSHHGQLEFGSPKLPQFPEALLLHYLDDMDSKMECMRALIESDRQVDGCFTTYNNALSRTALKMDRFLNPASGVPACGAPAVPVGAPELPSAPSSTPAPAPVPKPDHPLFAAVPSESVFAGKLQQALQPAGPKQES